MSMIHNVEIRARDLFFANSSTCNVIWAAGAISESPVRPAYTATESGISAVKPLCCLSQIFLRLFSANSVLNLLTSSRTPRTGALSLPRDSPKAYNLLIDALQIRFRRNRRPPQRGQIHTRQYPRRPKSRHRLSQAPNH